MFVSFTILCFALIVGVAVISGTRQAAALALGMSMVLPNWLVREVGAVLFDLRLVCAIAAIGCVLLHPATRWQPRFVFADLVIVGLIGTQTLTELMTGSPTATQLLENVVQWLTPYAFGRVVWQSAEDGERLLPIMAVCCAILGIWATFESITRINPVQMALGYAGSLQGQHDIRWGLRRADGPLMHPIFMGMQMVLLLPFSLEAARRAKIGTGPNWWKWTPWLTAAGAFFSMSRGPQMGLLATAAIAAAILVPKYRLLIAVPMLSAAVLCAAAPSAVVGIMQRWSGEEITMSIDIRGEYYPYSGTTHRLLQVRVYEEALYAAGWFGYGSTALMKAKVPFVEDHLRETFSSIDNHYLQFTLQNGYLGIAMFLLLCCGAVVYALRAVSQRRDEFPALAAGTAGALLSITVLVWSVWLSSDLRFPLLTLVGMTACMGRPRPAEAAEVAESPVRKLRTLVPGHPPLRPGTC
ncbi:MAG: O-antigen ligase family protein [Planctomycetes bacterium]|nr:O-antigen ligase family protein [Planctomycetota bacterium]